MTTTSAPRGSGSRRSGFDRKTAAVRRTNRVKARRVHSCTADLADASWCTAPLGSPQALLLQQFCREHGGFEPKLEYPTDDVAMAQPLIAAGLAIALLPSLNLALPHPGVTVRRLPDTPPGRDIWCIRPAHQRLPAATAMTTALARAATRGSLSCG